MSHIKLSELIVAWFHAAFAVAFHSVSAVVATFYYLFSLAFPRKLIPAPKSLLITGAGSGIGAALALKYAAPGVSLALSDRDEAGLQRSAAACRAQGAQVSTAVIDVTDAAAMTAWVSRADAASPIDLAYACAGIGDHQDVGADQAPLIERAARITRTVFRVNVDGVHNTLLPLVEPMCARGKGQLVILSSVAGFGAIGPRGLAYSSSKAAVRVWGDGMRGLVSPYGVRLTVVCPSWIATPLTDILTQRHIPMPGLLTLPVAVEAIVDGVSRGLPTVSFTPLYYVLTSVMGGSHWMMAEARDLVSNAALSPDLPPPPAHKSL